MANYSDRIKPDHYSIQAYLDDLQRKKYQIPTFQREVVWEPEQVKKLWDSIYKFYPLGSILIWKTDLKLQNHRSVGGHVISDEMNLSEYQYILDGQQRTTSLLTSLYGGKIEGRPDFDPTLYFDLTIEDDGEIDDESYKERFLFWNEIDDRNGVFKRNKSRMEKFRSGLIVKLHDIKHDFGQLERTLQEGEYSDYDDPIRVRLRQIRDVLDKYRISSIELTGIQVSQVCQIFERINQAGKPLNIFDIVVAKTFRASQNGTPGFYLREMIEEFRDGTEGPYKDLEDLTYLQMLSVLINQNVENSGIWNITDRYLNDVKTEHIEAVWDDAQTSFRKLFDFFDNHLHLKGPALIPNRYYYMTLVAYFHNNPNPNYDLLKKYFWYYTLDARDLLTSTTQLWQHVDFLSKEKEGESPTFDTFLLDRHRLRSASYHSRARYSRAILCLLANQEPRDWELQDRYVLSDVYYSLTDKPNLHHIFPMNFISNNPGKNQIDANSLMNIAYLTQITNLQISDKNPLDYMVKFDKSNFEQTLSTHLVPLEILEWARAEHMPENALDVFIEKRIDLMVETIQQKLDGITVNMIDSITGEAES